MSQAEAKLVQWAGIPVETMSPEIGRQFLVGTGTMLARVLLRKGAHVPRHSHPNEQIAAILEGALRFRVWDTDTDEGREVEVRAGEVLCLPPDVPHEAWALEDTVDLDVFNPPREDWMRGDDAYLREGAGRSSDTAEERG